MGTGRFGKTVKTISLLLLFDNSLFLMGLSQGGFVATYVAGTRPQDIQRLIAFYPAYVLQDDARERIAGLSEILKTTTLMGVTIGRVYTEDALSFDIHEVMKNYTGNALIVHGTETILCRFLIQNGQQLRWKLPCCLR